MAERSGRWSWGRLVPAGLLVAAVAAALYFFYFTAQGQRLRDVQAVRQWIAARPTTAPAVFVGLYLLFSLTGLPVALLQVVGGLCFGIVWALVWCNVGAAVGAGITLYVGHRLMGDWFHERVEPYHERLRTLDEKLGHNGLLVVSAVRFSNLVPFGLANYAFALTRISLIDVVVGTVIGGMFGKMIYCAIGADPALLKSPRYWALLIVLNLILLSPLALRYCRPQWFRRIGIE
jgi:uncharacterized membrane protein YdjX (TVP38/TMEM64 family)